VNSSESSDPDQINFIFHLSFLLAPLSDLSKPRIDIVAHLLRRIYASTSLNTLLHRSSSSSSSSTPSKLLSLLSTHYHSLDPSIPLRHHLVTASHELKHLEHHARSTGLGSGNWEVKLSQYVNQIIQQDKPLAYILGTSSLLSLLRKKGNGADDEKEKRNK